MRIAVPLLLDLEFVSPALHHRLECVRGIDVGLELDSALPSVRPDDDDIARDPVDVDLFHTGEIPALFVAPCGGDGERRHEQTD